jgi:hypothetical protein
MEDRLDDLRAERDQVDARIDECEALLLWLDWAGAEQLYDVMEAVDQKLNGPSGWPHRGLYARYNALSREVEAIEHAIAFREWLDQRADYYAGLGVT